MEFIHLTCIWNETLTLDISWKLLSYLVSWQKDLKAGTMCALCFVDFLSLSVCVGSAAAAQTFTHYIKITTTLIALLTLEDLKSWSLISFVPFQQLPRLFGPVSDSNHGCQNRCCKKRQVASLDLLSENYKGGLGNIWLCFEITCNPFSFPGFQLSKFPI